MTQAHRASAYPDVQSAEFRRSIEMLARQTPSDVRTCRQRARGNNRVSSVGTVLRQQSADSPESGMVEKSSPSMADWLPPADLVGGMMAAASFDSGVRSRQDERCWVESWEVLEALAVAARRDSN